MTEDDLNSMCEMLRKIGLNVVLYPPKPVYEKDEDIVDLEKGKDYHELTSNRKS